MFDADVNLMEHLIECADRFFEGHFTIMKFTDIWRVGFGKGHDFTMPGETFAEAAAKALESSGWFVP